MLFYESVSVRACARVCVMNSCVSNLPAQNCYDETHANFFGTLNIVFNVKVRHQRQLTASVQEIFYEMYYINI